MNIVGAGDEKLIELFRGAVNTVIGSGEVRMGDCQCEPGDIESHDRGCWKVRRKDKM